MLVPSLFLLEAAEPLLALLQLFLPQLVIMQQRIVHILVFPAFGLALANLSFAFFPQLEDLAPQLAVMFLGLPQGLLDVLDLLC